MKKVKKYKEPLDNGVVEDEVIAYQRSLFESYSNKINETQNVTCNKSASSTNDDQKVIKNKAYNLSEKAIDRTVISDGSNWRDLEFSRPEKTLRLGTVFSGIGAIEQSFIKMRLPHKIIFACDNGEIELIPLHTLEKKEFLKLKKDEKKLEGADISRYKELKEKIENKIAEIKATVKKLPRKEDKRRYIEGIYNEYAKDKTNFVKQTYFSNYDISSSDFHLDVRFLDGNDYANKVDIMVGGSPCQSFSSNGKRGGIADTRGTLFYEYARLISEVKPKCFIFENVRGMLVHDGGRTWSIIKSVFEDLDYTIYLNKDRYGKESPLLNAESYGIPQTRERIYLIGIRNGIQLKKDFTFPEPIILERFVPDFLESEVPANYYLGQKGFEFVTTHPTRAQVGSPIMNCQKANQQFNWNGDFIFEPLSKKHTPEILEKAYVGSWKGVQGVCRKFTPRECLRLMGFPDSFRIVVKDNIMYRQAGNSIVVNVLECLLAEIIKTGVFDND